jgi:hypothetical protein
MTKTASVFFRIARVLASGMSLSIVGFTTTATLAASVLNLVYYDFKSSSCNKMTLLCENLFSDVPSGKAVLILRVSCMMNIPLDRKFYSLELRRYDGTTMKGRTFLGAPVKLYDEDSRTRYVINADTYMVVPASDTPAVSMLLDNLAGVSFNLQCTIHGVLHDYTPPA